MATASIQSSIPSKGTVTDASRDDLVITDSVTVDSVNTGTGYAWTIAYKPEGSSATFSGSDVAKSPGSFTVDVEGSYLIRLQFTDSSGTTEQFVRLRALTAFGSLKLVAAGETVAAVPVPVDITSSGWADDQNYNLNSLLGLIKSTRPSLESYRFDFDHSTTAGTKIITALKSGDVVLSIFVNLETVFDDATSNFTVGGFGVSDRFLQSSDTQLSTTNDYEFSFLDPVTIDGNLTITPSFGTSTTGSGFIIALVHKSYT